MTDSVRDQITRYLQVAHLASRNEIFRDVDAPANTINKSLDRLLKDGYVGGWPDKFADSITGREATHYFRTLKPFPVARAVIQHAPAPLARSVVTRHAEQASRAPTDLINAFSGMVAL